MFDILNAMLSCCTRICHGVLGMDVRVELPDLWQLHLTAFHCLSLLPPSLRQLRQHLAHPFSYAATIRY